MAGHEDHSGTGELVGDRHGLLRVAGVVAHFQLDLLAQDTAGGIQVGDSLIGASLHLLTESGVLAGHGAGDRDDDIGISGGRGECECRRCSEESLLELHNHDAPCS